MDSENIHIVCNQTNYTEEEAKEKLVLFQNDPIAVIKDFLGIPQKKQKQIESLNQEIYRQFRHKLNESIDIINQINYSKLNQPSDNN